MARARNIKPAFFTNDKLAECQPLARILFAGLWTMCDREGRLEHRSKRIKAHLLPYDDADIDSLLGELAARDFVQLYEVAGEKYIAVVAFLKHQNPHVKEPASSIPAPGKNGSRTKQKPLKNGYGPAESGIRNPSSGIPHPESITGLRPEVWEAWAKHRGNKLTAQAVKLQTTKLGELLAKGCDPNAVILQSIERGWSGLFEVKAHSPPGVIPLREKRVAAMAELTGQVRHERTINGVAERVGGTAVPALPGDLREPLRDDVGGCAGVGGQERVG